MPLLLVLLLIAPSSSANSPEFSNENCSTLMDIVQANMSKSPIVLVYNNNSTIFDWIFKINVTVLLVNIEEMDYEPTLLRIRNHNYILFVDDFNALDRAIQFLIRTKEVNTRGFFVINFQKPISKSEIKMSFTYLWKRCIYKTIVNTIKGNILVWYPYHSKNRCGTKVHPNKIKCKPVLDKWLPSKFNACPVNISWNMHAIFLWDPFNDTYPGVLGLVLNSLGKVMNFTPVYLKENSNFLIDFLKTNSFDLAKEDVTRRNIDLIVYGSDNGRLVELDNLQDVIQSVSYNLLIPSVSKAFLNVYINMFKVWMIMGTTLSLIVSSWVWKFVMNEDFGTSFFNIFRLLFQLSMPLSRKIKANFSAKCLLATVIMFAHFMNMRFNSHLSSRLTHPGRVMKLGERNQYQSFKTHDNFNAFSRFLYFTGINQSIGRTSDSKWVIIPSELPLEDILEEYLSNYSTTNNLYTDDYEHSTTKVKRLQISSQQLLTGIEYKIATRRGLPINKKLNYWIEYLAQTGLPYKWMSDQSVLLPKFVIQKPGYMYHVALKFEDLLGAFYALLLGWSLSFVGFFAELLIFRYYGLRMYTP